MYLFDTEKGADDGSIHVGSRSLTLPEQIQDGRYEGMSLIVDTALVFASYSALAIR